MFQGIRRDMHEHDDMTMGDKRHVNTTLTIVFSVTIYLELFNAISIYYITYGSPTNVNLIGCDL